MKSNVSQIQKAFADLLSHDSKSEKIDHHEHMIMFKFLSEVQKVMEEKNINKKELAKMIGTSASFVTQIFRGDKIINLNTLAKIEVELGMTFKIKLLPEEDEIFSNNDLDEDEVIKILNKKCIKDGVWMFHNKRTTVPITVDYSAINNLELAQIAGLNKAV